VNAVTGSEMSEGDLQRQLAHERLGHVGAHGLDRLITEELVEGLPVGIPVTGSLPEQCEACIVGKGTQRPFPKESDRPATRVLQRVHMDTAFIKAVPGVHGELYFDAVHDEFSGYNEVLVFQSKKQIAEGVKALLVRWMNKLDTRIVDVRTDRGTEFWNKTLRGWTDSMGIGMEASCPRIHQQNGRAERAIRHIKDMARTMMVGAKVPRFLWSEAVRYATWVSNCLPVSGKPVTPYQAFWGVKPDVSNLKKWGCRAYAWVPHEDRKTLDERFVAGTFVGLKDGTKGWRIRLPNRTTMVSRDVRFLETKEVVSEADRPITEADLCSFLDDEQVTVEEGEDLYVVGPETVSQVLQQCSQPLSASSQEQEERQQAANVPSGSHQHPQQLQRRVEHVPARPPLRVAVTPPKGGRPPPRERPQDGSESPLQPLAPAQRYEGVSATLEHDAISSHYRHRHMCKRQG
jgi:hypothetical protein